MPVYEYKCATCSHRFERWERLTAPTVQACPQCGQPSQRQIGAPALQFKGSGWYVTDYAKSGSTGRADSSETTAKSESKGEATSASKGEATSTSKGESTDGGSKEGSTSSGSSTHQAA